MKFFQDEEYLDESEFGFEMAKFSKNITNYNHPLWLDEYGWKRKNNHNGIRVIIEIEHELIPFVYDKKLKLFKCDADILTKKQKNEINDALKFLNSIFPEIRAHWYDEICATAFGVVCRYICIKNIKREEAWKKAIEDGYIELNNLSRQTLDLIDGR